MLDYGMMPGRYPAIVKSYDQARRTCRVEIPGITDNAEVLPEAEIEFPIGDKSRASDNNEVHPGVTFFPTEIEICPSDTVWVAFIGGDSRYPIITGYRNPRAGNSSDWRRWHHKNVEIIADDELRLVCGVPESKGNTSTIIMTPDTIFLDAKNIIRNMPHPRPFLGQIYGWWHELNDSVAEWAGDIFRKKGCTKQCQKGKG